MTSLRTFCPALRNFAAVFALCASLPAFAAGELDCTFDGDGRKVQSLSSGTTDQANDIEVLADGSIVTLTSESDSSPAGNLRFSRFLANGSLDPSFGGGTGTVLVTIPGVAFGDFAFVPSGVQFARDSLGRYVVVGSIVVGGLDREVFVGRFTSAGALDATFGGGDGWTSFDWSPATNGSGGALDSGREIAIDASDRPVVAGTVDGNGPIFNPSNADFGFARLTTAGDLDATWGTGGITLVSSPGTTTDDTLREFKLDPSGRAVAVGDADPNLTVARDAMVVRLTAAGLPDPTFDGDGVLLFDLTQTGAIDSSGDDAAQHFALTTDSPAKIVLAGFAPQSMAIARFSDSGVLDTSWGGDGIVSHDFEVGSQNILEHLIVQPDGKLLVTGWIPFDFSVMRLEVDGDLDPTWGGDGRQTFNILNLDRAYAAALMADGRLVMAGGTANDTDMALARLLGDASGVAGSTTSITSDLPDPSVTGQVFTVSVSVAPTSGATAPTGSVTVGDGVQATPCVLVPPGSGTTSTASCSLALTTLGARSLTASYPGDGTSICPSVSPAEAHQVVANTSSTSITSDLPDPSVVGEAVLVAYTVTAAAGTPVGNVTVSDGVTSCIGTVATGSCSLAFPSPGARTLSATYAGGGGISGSTSAGVPHTVDPAPTTTTIDADTPDPSVVGETITVAYTVAVPLPGAGTPTGTVTVTDGVDSCSASVAAGQCSLALGTAGARNLTASYGGDANFSGSTSAGVPHTVDLGATTTTIDADAPDPSAVNGAVQVSWVVAPLPPAVGVPTGTVTVTVSGGAESCAAAVAAGSCTLNLAALGSRTLTATFSGDSSLAGSADTETHEVVAGSSITTIDAEGPDPSVTGQPIQVDFSVTSPSGTPTGSVTVSDGAGGSCTGVLAGGAGGCSFAPAQAGALTLTADYSGDATIAASQGTTGHTVNPAATTLTLLGVAPEPSIPGDLADVFFTLAVVAPGAGTPSGTVTVSSGALSCTAPVADGTCAIAFPASGTFALTATYSGDPDFAPAAAAIPIEHEVRGVVEIPTLNEAGLLLLALVLGGLAAWRLRRG
jgi:uncharacterized delta-60 repeat protein